MITYSNIKQKRRANTMLSLGFAEYEAAKALIEKKFYRESVIHLYFCCFYLAQAVCADALTATPSHKSVERELNKKYGRGKQEIPKLYVKLHNKLHKERNHMSYRTSIIPSERSVEKFYKTLTAYVKCVDNNLDKITVIDIIQTIHEKNNLLVKEFSYDIYCPKTYRHHNRITVWQPPSYLNFYAPEKLIAEARVFMKKLGITESENYVWGLNSKIDQYSNNHYLMLDFDSLDTEVESVLAKNTTGILLKSGRGYHFIGNDIIEGRGAWEKEMRRIKNMKELKGKIDKDHVDISIKRGYSTLRITSNKIKPQTPIFYKEI